jgi:hypothetical protein
MKRIVIVVILIVFSVQSNLFAQNYLWLTNGKKLKIGDYKIESPDIISYKNQKGKIKSIQSFDVFSVIESSGKENVIYLPDTSYQGAFTVPEMRSYVQGQYDAGLKFKSPLTTIGGFVLASGSSLFINPMYVFVLSTGYCSAIGLTKASEKKLNIPAEFAQNEHYKLGYKKTVKHKRITNAIIGSGIGLIVGIGTIAIINK